MNTATKNALIRRVAGLIEERQEEILLANQSDLAQCDPADRAIYDRLLLNGQKIEGMINSLLQVAAMPDPVGKLLYSFSSPQGLSIENRSSPFGTILIIYESRPDVTIEAAVIAFKAGNRILLKGGREARLSNLALIACWQTALREQGLDENFVTYLDFSREQIQTFLRQPDRPIDLIVPRGGEKLIAFVKEHASCPVLVSGRGNNFAYIHPSANWEQAIPIIRNAKTQKISACNALDKVLLDKNLPDLKQRAEALIRVLEDDGVEVLLSEELSKLLQRPGSGLSANAPAWDEEFLAMKIVLGLSENLAKAIEKINRHSGGHSALILAEDKTAQRQFMDEVDAAAVYSNASTRFTDGNQFGMGAELAISTDKLHHRGPLGLEQLVTNKWYIFGNGQTRP